MSIFDFLERLRKKPEMARRRILVGTTFGITVFIFLVWSTTTFYGLESVGTGGTVASSNGPVDEVGEAFGSFFEQAKADIASVQAVLSATTSATTTAQSEGEDEVPVDQEPIDQVDY